MAKPVCVGPVALRAEIEKWPLAAPFRISGYTFTDIDVLVVALEHGPHMGRGEAVGVYYRGENAASLLGQVQQVRASIESGISRHSLQAMLPPGGARNALDCALWDLEAKVTGQCGWEIAGINRPQPLLTTFTCGAGSPKRMAATAHGYAQARAIKIKLTGELLDADRVRAVREARPDVWLGVDANQGFSRESLAGLVPVLMEAGVKLIEQPFPIGQEGELEGIESPIPIAADESVQSQADMESLVGRFDVVNIKLDKCGGLTEAIAMARMSHELGLETMIGNMLGTSLAMAPAYLVGQLCKIVDLDGPILLKTDRPTAVEYFNGSIRCPPSLWGNPTREE